MSDGHHTSGLSELGELREQLSELWKRLPTVLTQCDNSVRESVDCTPRTRLLIAWLWISDSLRSVGFLNVVPSEVFPQLATELTAHFTAGELRELNEILQRAEALHRQIDLNNPPDPPGIDDEPKELREVIRELCEARELSERRTTGEHKPH